MLNAYRSHFPAGTEVEYPRRARWIAALFRMHLTQPARMTLEALP